MAKKPPPLPTETFQRVLRLASFDGRILMIVAGTLALLHASAYQLPGAIVGCLVAGAGALELHGAGLLRNGEARGVDWLVRSQWLLLATMLIFAATQLISPDLSQIDRVKFTPEMLQTLDELNLTKEQFAKLTNTIVYLTVGIVTLLYQGAMILFYQRHRRAVTLAVAEESYDDRFDEVA
jgi:hypothetical protein